MDLRQTETSKMVFFHRESQWITYWTQTVASLNDSTVEIVSPQNADLEGWVKNEKEVGFSEYAEYSEERYLLCEGNREGIAALGRLMWGKWARNADFNEVARRIFRSFRTILWVSREDGAKNQNEMAKLLEWDAVDVWNALMESEEMRYRLITLLRRERRREQLRRAATLDFLTGLPTRRAFEMTACHAIATAVRMGTSCCVAMLDLDRFKDVNDRYHHTVGDALLCEFAERLRRYSRKSDFYARWGGDEFVCFLSDTQRDGAYRWAERMRSQWTRSVMIDGHEIPLSVSVGIAPLTRWNIKATVTLRGTTAEQTPEWMLDQMLREADAAMYREKNEKKQTDAKTGDRNTY